LSPCFLVAKPEKDGKKNYRLIVDLRRINSFCKRLRCKFETLKGLAKMSQRGDWMVSFDVSDAFYHLPVRECDRQYFRFIIDGEVMQLNCLPMGWTNSPYYLTKIFRTIVGALRGGPEMASRARAAGQKGLRPGAGGLRCRCLPYLDDFLCLFRSKEEAVAGAKRIKQLLADLGLAWEARKCQWEPVQVLEHLGLTVDTARGLFLVSPKRVKKLEMASKDLLCRAAEGARWVPSRVAAQFAGLAQSVHLAVPAARFFLRELHDCIAAGVSESAQGWGGQCKLTYQAMRDLRWWRHFDEESRYNGRAIFKASTNAVLHCDAAVDSQGRGGWGAVLNGTVPARGFWAGRYRSLHITHLELIAVRLAVETFLEELRGRTVRLHEDNQAVVHLLHHFSSRSPALQEDLRALFWLLDSNSIELQAEYIPSKENVFADWLSRYLDRGDWSLVDVIFQEYEARWGTHTVDRFATGNNAKCPRFNSRWREPLAEAVDGLAQSHADWRRELNFVNGPWSLLGRIVQKLRDSGAAATVVVPFWPTASWFSDLMDMTSEYDVISGKEELFCPGSRGSSEPQGVPGWDVAICRVPLRVQRTRD
jgi:ribonuclease HI